MTTLHLGVIDIGYADAPDAAPTPATRAVLRRGRRRAASSPRTRVSNNFKTTGDVAEILENRYHVMQTFFDQNSDMVVKALDDSMEGALQTAALRGNSTFNLSFTAEGEAAIEARFREFLSLQEMDAAGVPGVPTAAALAGVSHRFKHPYAKRPARPSFVDTGLYQASFKAWVTG